MQTFQDEQDDYEKLRQKIMTEEQQKLANQIRVWYSDAYSDKSSRNVFDEMEQADKYWEGDVKESESDSDPNSNTNVVNSTIEGQVAYLVEQNIAIEATPRGPSDLPFRDKAVTLMTFCKEQNKLRRQLDVHERRRKKYGVGIFRVLFDPDALDGMGLPIIEAVNPDKVFPDPIVHDIYKINEGRFLIETFTRSIASAKDKYGEELAAAIVPGFVPTEYSDDDEQTNGEVGGEFYIHMLVWTHGHMEKENDEGEKEKKKVLRLIEMSGCGVILRDTAADKIEICEDDIRYPYFFTPDMYREGTVWAKSTASLLIPIQDTIDDIEDQIILNARLTGNPQRLVDTRSEIDIDKLTNEPALAIPHNGTATKPIENLQPGQMPAYVIQHRDKKLMQELGIVSRWSWQMNGIKQAGVNTATESLGLQQAGTQNITHDKMLLEDTLSELFSYCLTLMLENYTDEEVFSITEQADDFQLINPSEMRHVPVLVPASEEWKRQFAEEHPDAQYIPDFMPHSENLKKRIALDISVKVGAGLPNNKAFVFQMIEKLQPMLPPYYFLKLVKDYTGLPIDESLTQPPEPVQPPMQQPQQPMQDATVQGLTQGMNPMQPQGGMM